MARPPLRHRASRASAALLLAVMGFAVAGDVARAQAPVPPADVGGGGGAYRRPPLVQPPPRRGGFF
jgi:hypothetical protein